ncbi:MAG: ATP-binding protein [Candidatus Omnitrophica bacterium]|nr:ATP-binding protein [Candidatus Omnitrophota bacterium]
MKFNFYFLPHLFSAFIVLSFSIFVFVRNRKSTVNRSFSVLGLTIFVWLLFSLFASNASTEANSLFWYKISYIGVILIPCTFSYFIASIIGRKNKLLPILRWLYASFFILLLWLSNLLIEGLHKYSWGLYPRASLVFHPIFLFTFLAFFTDANISLVLKIWGKYSIVPPLERLRTMYVFLGAICGSGGMVDFLPNYGINIYPFGFLFMALFPAIYAYAIIKYRLMDIRVFISAATAFLISYPFLLSIPFFFGYRMYPVIYPYLGIHWWLAPSGLLLFFAITAPIAYRQIRQKMEERLLADQKRYHQLLLQAATGMVREYNLEHLAKLIVYIVKKIVKIEFACIFLDNQEHKSYQLKAIRNRGISKLEIPLQYNHPLIEYIKNRKEPFFYEDVPLHIRNLLKFPLSINVVIPSFIQNNLLGFVFLGEKLNHQPYTQDDIIVFKTLSYQSALAINYCIFLGEFKKAQEKVFNAEKQGLIGGMADGVAHQIRNRLNQFSIAAGELEAETEEFIKNNPKLLSDYPQLKDTLNSYLEISKSIISNVKHSASIINGMLEFAKKIEEKETNFKTFHLKEIITSIVEMLKIKHQIEEFPLECEFIGDDTVYGIEAQIIESLYNLFDNSYEATIDCKYYLTDEQKQTYKAKIKLKVIQFKDHTLIIVSDNGVGIKEEDRSKIFAPFFTTKSSYKSGTGIGLYTVKRMIEEIHKGRMWFESKHLEGTTFYIELPKKTKELNKN